VRRAGSDGFVSLGEEIVLWVLLAFLVWVLVIKFGVWLLT
jgi:hypothetical protein